MRRKTGRYVAIMLVTEKWPVLGKKVGHSKGYIRLNCPSHPNADKDGYVYEHVYVASKVLGRGLKKNEVAHHVYGDVADNKRLLICTHSYHRALHARLALSDKWPEFKKYFEPSPHKCEVCGVQVSWNSKLCEKHFRSTYHQTKSECRVMGCKEMAGKRSGLCAAHLRYLSNKRRYHKGWDYAGN